MRILALVTDAFVGYGGIARYNCDLLDALAGISDDDVDITILPRLGPAEGFQVTANLRQSRPFLPRALFSAFALLQTIRLKPDIIYCGHIYHGPLALILAKLSGARLISQLHGTEVWRPLDWLHLQPLLLSDLVLCVSRDTKARYRKQAGAADNSFVLANTVGPSFNLGNRSLAQDRFAVKDCRVLLSVGRLDSRDGYKGHDRVIEAMPKLRASNGVKIVYLVAGLGEDRTRLEQLAERHGVADRVRFLGKVPEADLPDLYRAADLFVLPSTGEGFGIVYLEAMACGTPAVGLSVGGVPDPLGDGELGTLLPPTADLAIALQDLIYDAKPDGTELSRAVRERFGIDAFTTRVGQALKRVARQGQANAKVTSPAVDARVAVCAFGVRRQQEAGIQ